MWARRPSQQIPLSTGEALLRQASILESQSATGQTVWSGASSRADPNVGTPRVIFVDITEHLLGETERRKPDRVAESAVRVAATRHRFPLRAVNPPDAHANDAATGPLLVAASQCGCRANLLELLAKELDPRTGAFCEARRDRDGFISTGKVRCVGGRGDGCDSGAEVAEQIAQYRVSDPVD